MRATPLRALSNVPRHLLCSTAIGAQVPGRQLELGGTAKDDEEARVPVQQDLDRILADATQVVPSLARAGVGDPWVGLRPKRKGGIRLELEWVQWAPLAAPPPSGGGGGGGGGGTALGSGGGGEGASGAGGGGRAAVVHNYGRGGSGMCVSYGCAEDACRLVQAALDVLHTPAGSRL